MLILRNLQKVGDLISAEYGYSNFRPDWGSIVYDIKKHEFVEIHYNKEDSESIVKYGFGKIENAIKQMMEADIYPSYYEYYWY